MQKLNVLFEFVKKRYKIFYVISIFVVIILASVGLAYVKDFRAIAPDEPVKIEEEEEGEAEVQPAPEEAKKEVAKNPPRRSSGGNISGSATPNSDGSTTVTASTGAVDSSDQSAAASAGPSGSIGDIEYIDQTGKYPGLENQLKNYMASNLLVKDEVTYLYAIIVKNAGDSGWAGLYSASYIIQPNGDITSAWGYITLNTYYYESSPYFVDYMKLILSHEYGHHYTLYHKWVKWDLGMNTRFPDSYYAVRPLTKTTTTYDYSLGWANCDAEIIAEDYSYLYSGYGYHAMSGTYGYPSAGTRTWLINEPSGPNAPPASDNPPTVSITTPTNGATISGSVAFSADASDDNGVSKVVFIIDSTILAEDTSAPYSTTFNSASYSNGSHTLKAVVTDSVGQTAESSISVTISNTKTDSENPTVQITQPPTDPYTWASGNLQIQATATDNVAVSKIELYINNTLVATENAAQIDRIWLWNNVGPGAYTLKAKSYDTSSNSSEVSIVINKS
jgi:hypothetical protein